MEFADRIYRAGAHVADRLACRQPSQNMQSAAEPMLGKKSKKGESRSSCFLMVTVCCFVACSAAICMRAGRVTASYLEPVHLLELSP
jgi:hypothetical protein